MRDLNLQPGIRQGSEMGIQQIQQANAVTISRHRIACGYYDTPEVIDETVLRVWPVVAFDRLQEQAEWDKRNDGERFDGQS